MRFLICFASRFVMDIAEFHFIVVFSINRIPFYSLNFTLYYFEVGVCDGMCCMFTNKITASITQIHFCSDSYLTRPTLHELYFANRENIENFSLYGWTFGPGKEIFIEFPILHIPQPNTFILCTNTNWISVTIKCLQAFWSTDRSSKSKYIVMCKAENCKYDVTTSNRG